MPDWLAPALFSATLGVQAWILLAISRLQISSAENKMQLGRLVSDIESEKGTRKRLHENFDERIRSLETHHRRA